MTLIFGPSRPIRVNILVTIYYIENLEVDDDRTFERIIGVGQVVDIQGDGLIQVLALRAIPAESELWQRIRNRETTTLRQVIVRPSININEAGIGVRFDE